MSVSVSVSVSFSAGVSFSVSVPMSVSMPMFKFIIMYIFMFVLNMLMYLHVHVNMHKEKKIPSNVDGKLRKDLREGQNRFYCWNSSVELVYILGGFLAATASYISKVTPFVQHEFVLYFYGNFL